MVCSICHLENPQITQQGDISFSASAKYSHEFSVKYFIADIYGFEHDYNVILHCQIELVLFTTKKSARYANQ